MGLGRTDGQGMDMEKGQREMNTFFRCGVGHTDQKTRWGVHRNTELLVGGREGSSVRGRARESSHYTDTPWDTLWNGKRRDDRTAIE